MCTFDFHCHKNLTNATMYWTGHSPYMLSFHTYLASRIMRLKDAWSDYALRVWWYSKITCRQLNNLSININFILAVMFPLRKHLLIDMLAFWDLEQFLWIGKAFFIQLMTNPPLQKNSWFNINLHALMRYRFYLFNN